MTRRQFFTTLLASASLALAVPAVGQVSGWRLSRLCRPGFKGVFLTKGNSCLALYRDRWGNALTYWSDMTKQQLPWAVGFPYNGEYLLQRSIWKSPRV